MANDLLSLIREKQAAIAALQAELDEARRLLLGEGGASAIAQQSRDDAALRVVSIAQNQGTGKSSTVLAADALRAVGRPLHISELLREIKDRYGEDVKRDTLVGNLSRLIKNNRTFRRVGPNVYDVRQDEKEQEHGRMAKMSF